MPRSPPRHVVYSFVAATLFDVVVCVCVCVCVCSLVFMFEVPRSIFLCIFMFVYICRYVCMFLYVSLAIVCWVLCWSLFTCFYARRPPRHTSRPSVGRERERDTHIYLYNNHILTLLVCMFEVLHDILRGHLPEGRQAADCPSAGHPDGLIHSLTHSLTVAIPPGGGIGGAAHNRSVSIPRASPAVVCTQKIGTLSSIV